jgi:hypothetical protein
MRVYTCLAIEKSRSGRFVVGGADLVSMYVDRDSFATGRRRFNSRSANDNWSSSISSSCSYDVGINNFSKIRCSKTDNASSFID